MVGIALSGKTTYRKSNFTNKVVVSSYFNNNRQEEMSLLNVSTVSIFAFSEI